MPNPRYLRGRRAEYTVAKLLRDQGYFVVRAAGSKGPVDLVGVPHPGGQPIFEVLLIQVKTGSASMSLAARERLYELCMSLGPWFYPVLATVGVGASVELSQIIRLEDGRLGYYPLSI